MNARDFMRKRGRIEHAGDRPQWWRTRALKQLIREARAALVVSDSRVVGYMLPTGETVCVKRRFRDQLQAETQLVQIERSDLREKRPIRSYYCTRCSGWHVTSQARSGAPERNTSE